MAPIPHRTYARRVSRRAAMWISFQLGHVLMPLTSWAIFHVVLYASDSETWRLLFGDIRWWALPLVVLPAPLLYVVGFSLRRKIERPRIDSNRRRRWRAFLLVLWVFFSCGAAEEVLGPQGEVRLAITWAGFAALAWWGAWRIERTSASVGTAEQSVATA